MRAKYLFFFISAVSALSLFQFTLSTTTASAADPSEYVGQTIQGRWLGSFNTKAPDHSFCIDGFRGYPRASYNWRMTEVKAPEVAYSLWRFGRDINTTDAAALSWYIHATNKLGHNNAPGYSNLPKSTLPPAIENRIDFIQSESYQNAGPYRLLLIMKNSVTENRWADGTVKLVGGRGQVITDGYNNRKITVSLNGGRFGTGQASRTFSLTNGVSNFQYRRANNNVNVIRGNASISYAPTTLRRFKSNVDSAQRVVSFMVGDSFADSNSTAVRDVPPPPADTASIRLIKHGRAGIGPSYPLEGAVFAINKSTSPPGPNADRERTNANGVLRFDDLETNTNYYLHEISAPAGHKKPTSGIPVPVTTGGNNSVVEALNGNPLINSQTLFDLALRKYIYAVNDQPTGQDGTGTPLPTEVKVGDIIQHRIVVFNQHETPGWAESIVDYIPEGYDFVPELNQDWTFDEVDRQALRNTNEFQLAADPTPGVINGDEPQFTVDIYLRVNSKLYTSIDDQAGVNFAEICQDGNDFNYSDIDSTPDCQQSNDIVGGDNIINNNNNDEDDQDYDQITPQDIPASTEATKSAKVGQTITDILETQITMPEGLQVIFEAYSDNQCSNLVYSSQPILTTEEQNRIEDRIGFKPTTHGRYFWVARIFNPADQREYFRGQCGDPNEISRVFNIVTNATKSVQLGSKIRDLARVSGDLPEGSSIRFKLYKPGDDNCQQEPVYVSDLIPTVDGKTEYFSDSVLTRQVGIYRWVEELVGEEDNILTRGECGIENENSHVWNISTVALAKANLGQNIYDVAIVTGSVPAGAKVRFKLYGPDDTSCQNPVFISNIQPVPGPGYYQSSNYKTEDSGEHYWVEELLDQQGQIIGRGICGLENETTIVFDEETKNKKEKDNPSSNPDAPPSQIVDQSIPVTG
jgi:hypothetical protein